MKKTKNLSKLKKILKRICRKLMKKTTNNNNNNNSNLENRIKIKLKRFIFYYFFFLEIKLFRSPFPEESISKLMEFGKF